MKAAARWLRRARPLLGTLVEIGARGASAAPAIDAAFDCIAALQARLSRFEPDSDIGRFNALAAGRSIDVDRDTAAVLRAARRLQAASGGGFDISLGSGPQGWALRGRRLHKLAPGVRLDLGGIGKGHAVDRSVACLRRLGCSAGWVNAGGDLRAFGNATLCLQLRDETGGGVRPWGRLRQGACATSRFAPGSHSTLVGGDSRPRHLSVIAPRCLWADALTKVAALDDGRAPPVLRAFGASLWWH